MHLSMSSLRGGGGHLIFLANFQSNSPPSGNKYWSNGSFHKRSTLPPRRKFLPSGGGGEKKLFLVIGNVLGHPKRVGGLTSNFLHGGGMDVFWNDPIPHHFAINTMPQLGAKMLIKIPRVGMQLMIKYPTYAQPPPPSGG